MICQRYQPEIIAQILNGELPEEQFEELLSHVKSCTDCSEELEFILDTRDAFTSIELERGENGGSSSETITPYPIGSDAGPSEESDVIRKAGEPSEGSRRRSPGAMTEALFINVLVVTTSKDTMRLLDRSTPDFFLEGNYNFQFEIYSSIDAAKLSDALECDLPDIILIDLEGLVPLGEHELSMLEKSGAVLMCLEALDPAHTQDRLAGLAKKGALFDLPCSREKLANAMSDQAKYVIDFESKCSIELYFRIDAFDCHETAKFIADISSLHRSRGCGGLKIVFDEAGKAIHLETMRG